MPKHNLAATPAGEVEFNEKPPATDESVGTAFPETSDAEQHEHRRAGPYGIAEPVLGVDAEGTFCNEALPRLTGCTSEKIVGRNAHDLFHHKRTDGSEHPAQECPFLKAFRLRQPAHSRGELFWRKQGSSVCGEYYWRPIAAPGSTTCMVVTVKDISGIEMSEEALRHST